MKKITTGTETLQVFRTERDAAVAAATKAAEEAEEAAAHTEVLAEMVSPSQETNLDVSLVHGNATKLRSRLLR